MGDSELAAELDRSAAFVGTFAFALAGAQGVLPDAIRYLGEHIRP